MDVNVIPVPEPVVHISGTSDISREYEDFKLGVRIFADVHIVMTTGSPTGNGKSFLNFRALFLLRSESRDFLKIVKMLRESEDFKLGVRIYLLLTSKLS